MARLTGSFVAGSEPSESWHGGDMGKRPVAAADAASQSARRPKRRAAAPEVLPAPIDLGLLDGYIGFHLRRAQETALRAFAATLAEPYKAGRFTTLLVIRLNRGLSQSDVCRAIGRDKSTMSPLIRELVHEGLVARQASEQDRRSVHLRLTPRGEVALDRLLERAGAHDARLDAIVGEAKPELIRLLRAIAGALA